jgi:type IV pilus assembly protein PilV
MNGMNWKRVDRTGSMGRKASGFTLIEVMIAVLVLGVGLLGFALLQTMSVRFAQSANQRTQATNLSYEMLDQMRTNRISAANYSGNYAATTTGCLPGAAVSPSAYKTVWQCRLQSALGAGSTATVTYVAGVATVDIIWGDERWNDGDGDGTVSAAESNKTFSASTRL